MSVGFGFSLPALVQYGGGGNNPFGQLGPTLDLSFAGTVTDLSDPNGYTLNTDFVAPEYQVAAQYTIWETNVGLVSKTFGDIIAFTRASTATYFGSTGTLQSAAVDAPRFDYDPSTLVAQGFLVEESRTNSIRNNTMVGAVAGTPGTAPTNWSSAATTNGLNRQIVGTGTANGITYIDIRYSGTTTAGTFVNFAGPESNTFIAATNGQAWTSSAWVAVVGGSTANLTGLSVRTRFSDAGGVELTQASADLLGATSTMQRFSVALTAANASTAFVATNFSFSFNNGVAIDITLRIGLPQLELGAFATSVIPTTTTALTRAADVASVNTLSPWYNASAGTIYAETQLISTVARNAAGFDLNDGTTNNRNIFRAFTTGSSDQNVVRSGGSLISGLSNVTTPTTAVRKTAAAYAVNDFAFTANGSTPLTTLSGAVPVGINTFLLGSAVAGTEFLNGYLRRITYYPTRLSNVQLQAITA